MIVKLTGGLCNTMFMYAFGRALSLDRNLPVQFCWQRATRDYELDKYNVQVELVDYPQNAIVYDEPSTRFDPGVYTAPASSCTYYRGYWQCPAYFEKHTDLIRKELTLKESVSRSAEEQAKILRDQNSVFIHVRRGDYLNPGTQEVHGVLSLAYYKTAISYIQERINSPQFYVLSDDRDLSEFMGYPVISSSDQHEDLYLMQACRHGIGANSSFSWWANWLADSPERIKIAPRQWFQKPELDTTDLIPSDWIQL